MENLEHTGAYKQTTEEITVSVEPFFLDEESEPDENIYVWAYHVRIENNGAETVQLQSRHWRITDACGNVREVNGDGVVGEHPVLKPGESFEYISGAHLPLPSGIMVGYYQMKPDGGIPIKVDIPAFSLDSTFEKVRIH